MTKLKFPKISAMDIAYILYTIGIVTGLAINIYVIFWCIIPDSQIGREAMINGEWDKASAHMIRSIQWLIVIVVTNYSMFGQSNKNK